jgi:hypothetical protein
MTRTEILDPRRFGNHLVRGLTGWERLFQDYLDGNGVLTRGDLDALQAFHRRLNEMVLCAQTLHDAFERF